MGTVQEKAERVSQAPLALVIGRQGDRDIVTGLGDLVSDTLHALAFAIERDGIDGDTASDVEAGVLATAERAIAHFVCEYRARIADPAEDEDALGGYSNPAVFVEVTG